MKLTPEASKKKLEKGEKPTRNFGSVLKVKEGQQVSDEQLHKMATDAHVWANQQEGKPVGVTTAGTDGKEVIIETSQTGGKPRYQAKTSDGQDKYPDTAGYVAGAEKTWEKEGKVPATHGNEARCGEINTMCTWEDRNKGKKIEDANYRMVSVHDKPDTKEKLKNGETYSADHVEMYAPCDGRPGEKFGKGGCKTVTDAEHAKINIVKPDVGKEDYNAEHFTPAN
ncbi:unnamed protein product [Clonostachys rosea]|uniref:Hypervirulence associated protein TUDOR domain-containing protein n=1 Tax=Bionectria ochroleuca TaxID=29856 RepID=A0ABY6TU96_BIOOC|nr:unnamed protein product [Clonostachys rosea]